MHIADTESANGTEYPFYPNESVLKQCSKKQCVDMSSSKDEAKYIERPHASIVYA